MRFYLCHTPEGRKRLVTRQDEAKKLDKNAELIDIPVDQAGIKAGYEELFDRIFDLENQTGGSAPTVAPEQEPSDGDAASVAEPAVQSAPVHPASKSPNTACPKCKFTPRMAEDYTKRIRHSATVDGLCEAIEHDCPDPDVHRLVNSVIFRLQDMAKSKEQSEQSSSS